MIICIILAVLVIIGAVLKIFLILNADIPEWVKWLLIFRK